MVHAGDIGARRRDARTGALLGAQAARGAARAQGPVPDQGGALSKRVGASGAEGGQVGGEGPPWPCGGPAVGPRGHWDCATLPLES